MPDTVKTFRGWHTSGLPLDQYLQVGDLVDQRMFDYCLNVLPPAYWPGEILQIGEAVSDGPHGTTFATLQKTAAGWMYKGNCYLGQTEHVAG